MTIQEAEEFYKAYNGNGFFMWREEPQKYADYRKTKIPKKYLQKWDREILEKLFDQMRNDQGNRWIYQCKITEIIFNNHSDPESDTCRLLDEMEKMDDLSLHERTLIIENFAGRTQPMHDGGCYLICKKTRQAARMNRIMEEQFFSDPSQDARYRRAIADYRKAFKKFAPLRLRLKLGKK